MRILADKTTMPRAQVTGTKEDGYLPDSTPDPFLLAALADDMAPLRPSRPEVFDEMGQYPGGAITNFATSVGDKISMLLELAGIKAAIRTWHSKQPDQVLREASAYSARLTEVWTELRLLEAHNREWLQVRTMQVQPVLDEIDRQYRFAQSRIAMARQDIDLMRGT